MSNHTQQVVQKLWNYCNVPRDDGLSYGDYVEQLTHLLFLKMAHEQTQPPWRRPSPIPAGYDWPSLMARDGDADSINWVPIEAVLPEWLRLMFMADRQVLIRFDK